MSKHDIVLCRSFGDEPLVRLVWSVTDEGVLICEQADSAAGSQDLDSVPVLAPFDAVYKYDEELAERLDVAFHSPEESTEKLAELWRLASPYKGYVRAEQRGEQVSTKQ